MQDCRCAKVGKAGNATGVGVACLAGWVGGWVCYYGSSLVSHHHTAAPAPSCNYHYLQLAASPFLSSRSFHSLPPRADESLSRGFVIRAIGEAAPPGCRTRRRQAYQAIR